jgi:hypothetical protein
LWDSSKGKVYRNTHHTAEALQNEIRNVVSPILADELQRFRGIPLKMEGMF